MPEKTNQAFAAIKSAHSMSRGQEDPGFKAVQDFLQRFGYLRADTFRASQLDDATSEALALYQRRNGLTPTGTFDDQTREHDGYTPVRHARSRLRGCVQHTLLLAEPEPHLRL